MPQPGKYNKIISLQSKTFVTDDRGGQTPTWTETAKVWADVIPLRGRELVAAQTAKGLTVVLFYIRYRSSLLSSERVVYGGKNYDITAVVDVAGKGVELELTATVGLNEG